MMMEKKCFPCTVDIKGPFSTCNRRMLHRLMSSYLSSKYCATIMCVLQLCLKEFISSVSHWRHALASLHHGLYQKFTFELVIYFLHGNSNNSIER